MSQSNYLATKAKNAEGASNTYPKSFKWAIFNKIYWLN